MRGISLRLRMSRLLRAPPPCPPFAPSTWTAQDSSTNRCTSCIHLRPYTLHTYMSLYACEYISYICCWLEVAGVLISEGILEPSSLKKSLHIYPYINPFAGDRGRADLAGHLRSPASACTGDFRLFGPHRQRRRGRG